MTTLDQDIAEVIDEVGTQVRIMDFNGTVRAQESIRYDVNLRTSNPFHREFFLESIFSAGTAGRAGDIVEFVTTGQRNIIMSFTPRMFENEVVLYNSMIYKCNVSGELLRMGTQEGENQYHSVPDWQPVANPCHGAMAEARYDNELITDEEIGHIENVQMVLYVPASVQIMPDDRYIPVSGERPLRVGIVKRFAYEGTDVATLHEDTRL